MNVEKKNRLVKSPPDWFKLDYYPECMNYEEWYEALYLRLWVRWIILTDYEYIAQEHVEQLLIDVVSKSEKTPKVNEVNPAGRLPIDSVNVFESFYLSALNKFDEHEDLAYLASRCAENPVANKEEIENIRMFGQISNDKALRNLGTGDETLAQAEILDYRVPLSVDITADDETLIKVFKSWLSEFRESTKHLGNYKKPITHKDLRRWEKFKILPAYDLMLWSDICDVKLTDSAIGAALWPDTGLEKDHEFFSRSERYRKSTKKLIEEVMSRYFLRVLKTQIELSNFLNTDA